MRGDFAPDKRLLFLSVIALAIGALSCVVATVLVSMISFFTNLFFLQRISLSNVSPAHNQMGVWVVLVPVIGGLIIGLMARFGSEKIRGHGIPEALEAILFGKSIMNPKVAVLKPLSSAISIGSGGPFGAEGPIIMTGGAIGSIVAQFFKLSSSERKTLLVAGAAAGMSAIFSTPIAAVLLAVELLLFEWKPRSLIPVTLASVVAAILRTHLLGPGPLFLTSETVGNLGVIGMLAAAGLGLSVGLAATLVSSTLYKLEDLFSKLPFHWMWWPAIGGLFVGIGGYYQPRALGVGYDVIADFLNGNISTQSALVLVLVKATIWVFALASGTSGGVLAPLLIMGCAIGTLVAPLLSIGTTGFWSLIGMSAILGGMMRSPFTAILFALELTHNVEALPYLLVASIMSYAFTVFAMKRSILTEKIVRRGHDIFREYEVDPLERMRVDQVMTAEVITVSDMETVRGVVEKYYNPKKISKIRGYPVLDGDKHIVGMVTLGTLIEHEADPHFAKKTIAEVMTTDVILAFPKESCRFIAERMAEHKIGRLPVVDSTDSNKLIGIITRSDLLKARFQNYEEERKYEQILSLPLKVNTT